MLTSHFVHRKVAFGFVLAFLSILLDSIYDVSIKYLVSSYAVSQLIFLRLSGDIFTSVIVVSIQRKPSLIFARNYPLHILRAMCFVATMFSLYHSLHMLPLALVTILFMLGPIIISLLTPILLHERFRFVHIVIACSGFIGAYIILSPALSKFDVQMLLPVASAFFYAMVSILSRKLGRTDSATSIAVNGSILIMTMLLLFTVDEWTQLDLSDVVPLVVLVISGGSRRPRSIGNRRQPTDSFI